MELLLSAVLDFCNAHASADAVQAQAMRPEPDGRGGTYDHVYDVGEFQSDWGASRPEGVAEWLAGRPAAKVRLSALRLTGERHGPDDGWEETAHIVLVGSPSKGA